MSLLTELRNRGAKDTFFMVCDGLKVLRALASVVGNVWPQSIVQTSSINIGRVGMAPTFTCTTTCRTCATSHLRGPHADPSARGGCGAWTGQREQHYRCQR